jgi:putative alpha-1,2-mannosidase
LPGNDDGGTTSAWYVFSALGLYPAVPGVGGFSIGSPVFQSADIHLTSGQIIHIAGNGAAEDAPYVRALSLNGVAYTATWIDWDRLSNGATLEFTLGTTPPL